MDSKNPPPAGPTSRPGERAPDELPALVPDYDLIRRIGGGAYGEVWLARSKATGAMRAAKIVWRRAFADDRPFQREFEGIQHFEKISREHPSQLALFHIGRNDEAGYFYYVMELADAAKPGFDGHDLKDEDETDAAPRRSPPGDQLSAYVPRTLRADLEHGRLSAARVVEIGLALTEALSHLHAHGLVHRDVKPSNVIFVNGRPKLADIGLVTDASDQSSIVGTEGYLPPEGPGTPQADIFALGKLLYEAALGLDRRQLPKLPDDVRSWSDARQVFELNEIILKACESDPRRRYAEATTMSADLALLQGGQSIKRKRVVERRWAVAWRLGIATFCLSVIIAMLPLLSGRKAGHTPDPEAVRLYELGQWHYSQLTPEDHATALRFLTQAVERDPAFAQPYGELTALYVWNLLGVPSDQLRLQRTREIAEKASAIDPDLAETHIALSLCHYLERDWGAAIAEIERSIERNPNLPVAHSLYSFYLSSLDRFEESHREARLAETLELPGSRRVTAIVAAFPYIAERRFDDAIAQLQRVMELDKKFANGHFYLWLCHEAQSNYAAAINEFQQAGELFGLDASRVSEVCNALRLAHDAQPETGYLRKWIELVEAEVFGDPADCDLAGHYARLGEKQKALDELTKHFDKPNVWQQVKFLPLHDSLRGDTNFEALVKQAGLSN